MVCAAAGRGELVAPPGGIGYNSPTGPEAIMATLTITLPDEELRFVERAAERQGVGTEEYVRAVIAETRALVSRAELEAELVRRLDSPDMEADDAFWEDLKREVTAERAGANGHAP